MKTAKDQWIQMQCKSINEDVKYGRYNKRAYETDNEGRWSTLK